MIDIENDVFNILAQAARSEYPGIFLSGEYVKSPPAFPCISLVEIENSAYRKTQSSGQMENHAEITYELNVYSNKVGGKKAECKRLASFADGVLSSLGLTRTMLNPIPNLDDATIYRMTGRYQAIVSNDKVIFRR
ncbi:MAG TPA: hypothetical protein H9664_04390 [Firmicutes bacterium]|nr:hypothetical protein [Bacillota bacterium]